MAALPMTGPAFFVLTALADGPRHGYGIVGEVCELSQGRVQLKIGNLYGVLDRLAADGLIELDREEEHDGRPRRYYRLTQDGRCARAEEAWLRAATTLTARARARPERPRDSLSIWTSAKSYASVAAISPRHGCLARIREMPMQRLARPLAVLAGVLAVAGSTFAVAGCSDITPLSPDPAVSVPPPRHLGSPITEQVMHAVPPAASGRCPAGAVALFGSEPNVLRVRVVSRPVIVKKRRAGRGTTATPAATTAAPGVACYRPVGRPVTIASAGVSSVTIFRHQAGPDAYGFVVAFPAADVAALTAVMRQAYHHGDALGMRVAGQLWQAPQVRRELEALRGAQINLLSRKQAFHLHRLLVSSG